MLSSSSRDVPLTQCKRSLAASTPQWSHTFLPGRGVATLRICPNFWLSKLSTVSRGVRGVLYFLRGEKTAQFRGDRDTVIATKTNSIGVHLTLLILIAKMKRVLNSLRLLRFALPSNTMQQSQTKCFRLKFYDDQARVLPVLLPLPLSLVAGLLHNAPKPLHNSCFSSSREFSLSSFVFTSTSGRSA